MRRLALAVALGLVATLAPAITAPVSAAGGTTLTGAFWCANDERPLAGARIELWELWEPGLPKLWPNAKLRHVTSADANGGWGFRVSGDETNWFVRVVLSSAQAEVSEWILPWNAFADTASNQNDVPLHDYGVQVLLGDECVLWNSMSDASFEYQALRGTRPPYGEVEVEVNAPTASVPLAPYTSVWWPSGFETRGRIPKHEFGHTIRHSLDGGLLHFLGDTAAYWYLQHHSPTDCRPTNHGFAFNEGWADYWGGQRYAQCPGRDYRIEATVARSLASLEKLCDVTRQDMLQVLVDNPGRIHSFQEFRNRLECRARLVVPKKTDVRPPKASIVKKAVRSTLRGGRTWLRALASTRDLLVKEYDAAQAALGQPLPCVARPCAEEYARMARPWLVQARIAQLDATRATFAALKRRKVVKRLVRKPLRHWIGFTQQKRRRSLVRGRNAALPYIDRAVAAVQAGSASLVRDQVLGALHEVRRGVESGDKAALQSLSWLPAASVVRGGSTPGGIQVVSGITGEPVRASTTTLGACSSPPADTYGKWYPQPGEANYPGPPAFSGTVTPARAGTQVRLVYRHPTATGERVLVRTAATDAAGRFSHGITQQEWLDGYGRIWTIQAEFDGDDVRLASISKFCRMSATYP